VTTRAVVVASARRSSRARDARRERATLVASDRRVAARELDRDVLREVDNDRGVAR
jgi:hypothetical protein